MKVCRMLAESAVLAAVAVGAAAPAFAADGDGVKDPGEFIAYRDCNFAGPFFDFAGSVSAYVGKYEFFLDDFTPIHKNTSSVENRSAVNVVSAFFNGSMTGPRLIILPQQKFDLCSSGFNDAMTAHSF